MAEVDSKASLRALPAVDELLLHPGLSSLLDSVPRQVLVDAIRRVLQSRREAILKGGKEPIKDISDIVEEIHQEIKKISMPSLKRVINATGVVIHTNLGRSILSEDALSRVIETSRHYSNLEFDLHEGRRGSRYIHVESLICQICGSEAAVVVNNNAAAVMVSLNSLAEGKEVIVSRGELVEIGGSFRIPEIMRKSGARLVEVGTTNKTHPSDYLKALSDETALILKVHMSNYRICGFTEEVLLGDLVEIGRSRGIPVMKDLGSGSFVDFREYGIQKEPTVQEALSAGADLVTFSGDKLLGGPQAGIIVGSKDLLDRIKKNPLHRVVRVDKMTLAALEGTLRLYLKGAEAIRSIPTLRMILTPYEEIRKKALKLYRRLKRRLREGCELALEREESQVGGGALPLVSLPTSVVSLKMKGLSTATLEERLRGGDPPVIARINQDRILIDPRTMDEDDMSILEDTIIRIAGELERS